MVETMRVIYGGSQAERHWNNYGRENLLNLSSLKREDLEQQQEMFAREDEALTRMSHKLREKRLDLTTRYRTYSHLNQVCAYLTLCCFYSSLFDKKAPSDSMFVRRTSGLKRTQPCCFKKLHDD